MRSYVKPLILASDDLAEGIFTASGMIGGLDEDTSGNGGGTAGAGGAESDPSEFAAPEIDTSAQADPGIAAPDNGGEIDNGDSGDNGDNGDSGDNGGDDIGVEADAPDAPPAAENVKNYTLSLVTAGNEWYPVNHYDIRITNTSNDTVSSVSATIPYYGNVTEIAGQCSGTVNGDNTVTVVFTNYGNPIGPGATVGTEDLQIKGSGDFGLVM